MVRPGQETNVLLVDNLDDGQTTPAFKRDCRKHGVLVRVLPPPNCTDMVQPVVDASLGKVHKQGHINSFCGEQWIDFGHFDEDDQGLSASARRVLLQGWIAQATDAMDESLIVRAFVKTGCIHA